MPIVNPITPASIGAVPDTRQVIAGTNLTGGGPLSSDVTLDATGGGGGNYSSIFNQDFSSSPASVIPIDVTGYSDILIIGYDLVHANSVRRGLQVSVNNGVSYYSTSGNYAYLEQAGTRVNEAYIPGHSTASASARTIINQILNGNVGLLPKVGFQFGGAIPQMFLGSSSPITHIRVFGGNSDATIGTPNVGNFTSGVLQVLGR